MSRHKLVKQIDLNEELDDYDGGAAYDDDAYNEGDLTPSSSKLSLASLTLTAKNLVPRIKVLNIYHAPALYVSTHNANLGGCATRAITSGHSPSSSCARARS